MRRASGGCCAAAGLRNAPAGGIFLHVGGNILSTEPFCDSPRLARYHRQRELNCRKRRDGSNRPASCIPAFVKSAPGRHRSWLCSRSGSRAARPAVSGPAETIHGGHLPRSRRFPGPRFTLRRWWRPRRRSPPACPGACGPCPER